MNKTCIKQNIENFSKFLFEKFRVIKTLIPGSIPVYLAVLVAGLSTRIILFMNWMESPFRYYHTISGLDMKTIMGFAEQFCHGKTDFSIYKLFVYCCYLFSGLELNVPVIIVGQLALGIATSLLITYIALKILKNRLAALIAGICAALYSQELMYESVILIESVYVFTCTLSLAVIVHQNGKSASKTWLFFSGFAAALPALVRFPGILWTFLAVAWIIYAQLKHRGHHRNTVNAKLAIFLPILGLLTAFLPVSIFNFCVVSNFTPIPALPLNAYALKAGLETHLTSHSLPVKSIETKKISYAAKAKNYVGKFFSIFSAYEMPDNLNYYFVKEMLPPLNFMLGPLFLIPFATLGMIIALLSSRAKLQETLPLFIYFIAFAIPMTVFVPLGRYKLILLPVFCVFAAFAITFIIKNVFPIRKKYLTPVALALAASYALLFIIESPTPIERAEDFVAYGTAMEAAGSYDFREIEASYRIAYQLNPTESAVIHLANLLMRNSGFAEAESILRGFYESTRNNQTISISYASALLGTGKPEAAEKVLLGISEPENRKSKVNYYYQLGESRRLQGKKKEALACYQLSLDNADTDEQKKIIQRIIDKNVEN